MKFRTKPFTIEAVQWTGNNLSEIGAFCPLVLEQRYMGDGHLTIPTAEGLMRASPTDWIIKGMIGEFYPCKKEVFEAKYEPMPTLGTELLRAEILQRLQLILMSELRVTAEQVTMEADFERDLDADSLDSVEIIMAIEEEFGVSIPDEEAQEIRTVGQAVDWLEANAD